MNMYETYLFSTDIQELMTFNERLRDLYRLGNHTQARTLAKAILRNEPITRVEVTTEVVRVETPHFRGTHQVTTDSSGVSDVQRHGTYRYKSEAIDLSFTTRTMNQAAYDEAVVHLTKQAQTTHSETEHQSEATSGEADAPSTDENTSADDPADTSVNPVDLLKQLF